MRRQNAADVITGMVLVAVAAGGISAVWMAVAENWRRANGIGGHYETRHVKAHQTTNIGYTTDGHLVFTPGWVPDHDEQVWVKDVK